MENVPGLAQMGILEQAVEDLRCRGRYEVSARVLDAANFGIPQSRKRIVFIGVHRDLRKMPPELLGTSATAAIGLRRRGSTRVRYKVVADGPDASVLMDRLHDPWDPSIVTAEQAISDLLDLRQNTTRFDEIAESMLPEPQSAYQKLMRDGVDEVLTNVGVPRINS